MRTTLTLDDDAYQAVATLAAASGKRFGQVASDLIRQAVKPKSAPAAKKGLWFAPIVPPKGTPTIQPDKITELLGEEGF